MLKMVLGDRIIAVREKRGWNQTELAKRLGISKSVMSRIESGTRPLEDSLLVKLVEILEVSSDYLLGVEVRQKLHDELNEEDRLFIEEYKKLSANQKEKYRKIAKLVEES